MSRILMTGGGGFVASWVAPHLMARGHHLRVTVREGKLASLSREIEQIAVADLLGANWDLLLNGVDAVLHLAGRAHHFNEGPDAAQLYHRDNVVVSEAIATEAAKRKVGRFIFASSVKAMGESTKPDAPWTENSPCVPIGPYGESKLAAESAVHRSFPQGATILRLPLVYGPKSKGNFAALWHAVQLGVPMPFGGIENKRSLLFVGNLADAIERCLHAERARGQTFLVRDGTDVSTSDLIRGIARSCGTRPLIFSVPPAAIRLAANLVGKGESATRMIDSLVVDDSFFRTTLGWVPPFSLESALAETGRMKW